MYKRVKQVYAVTDLSNISKNFIFKYFLQETFISYAYGAYHIKAKERDQQFVWKMLKKDKVKPAVENVIQKPVIIMQQNKKNQYKDRK